MGYSLKWLFGFKFEPLKDILHFCWLKLDTESSTIRCATTSFVSYKNVKFNTRKCSWILESLNSIIRCVDTKPLKVLLNTKTTGKNTKTGNWKAWNSDAILGFENKVENFYVRPNNKPSNFSLQNKHRRAANQFSQSVSNM